MQVIHLLFNSSRKIYYNDKTKISIVCMSSVENIQKVINFFSFENHYPLVKEKLNMYI
jgi:hypothetical protein